MALSKAQLKSRIVHEMKQQGATDTGEHSWLNRMAEAIANAVVDEVQQNAEAQVAYGSSSGNHRVQ
jgi:hypothetical protein